MGATVFTSSLKRVSKADCAVLIQMKISIITVCYNSAQTIGDTLKSVHGQTYGNIEHIIVDGQSIDATLSVIAIEGAHVAKLVSEADKGIYDAMNKGIALATGEIIGFINADDFYASSDALAKVAAVFSDPNVEACYGDLCYVKQENTSALVRYWKSSEFHPGAFASGWCPPHPTFFVRREVYQRFGGFDLSYKIAADVELMMRFMEARKIRTRYIPTVLVKMRMGGTTNRNLGNILIQNREILRALQSHGLKSSVWRLIGSKLFSRGLQFLVKPMPGGA
jgi:glycosyltransferase involved in cell wall biosynthesis